MRWWTLVNVAFVVGCGGGGGGAATAPSAAPSAPVSVAAPSAPPAPASVREDFEAAAVGAVPPGWSVARPVKGVSFASARTGESTVLEISVTGDGSGQIKRSVDVARFRGKRVELTARATLESKTWRARAIVGLDVSRSGARGYGDRVRTDRIEAPTWQDYRAIGDIAADATGLDVVVLVTGASKAQIDDITVTVLGDIGAGDERSRALQGRALDNVVAFARLYGLVRYFHPSDEAAALDDSAWQRFVIRGVRAVESAASPDELQARLTELFAPIAPSVALRHDGEPAPAVAVVERPAVHWVHVGVGISKESAYTSSRAAAAKRAFRAYTMSIDPALVRGKEIKVTVRGRARLDGDGADAGLRIAETQADGKPGFHAEPEQQPELSATGSTITVSGKLSADAKALTLGVQVMGTAEAWFDMPVITADGKRVALPGWGTSGAKLAEPWVSTAPLDYTFAIGDKTCDRRACLHVTANPEPAPDLRPWSGVLGGGVAATVPLELSTRDGKTVPAATQPLAAAETRPLVASDRATRLAAIIIAWNVFEHFYPYFDVRGTDWMPELPRRIAEAAVDDGAAAMHATLRRLVYDLHDGHGWVAHASEDMSWVAPLLWERVEGKLTITQVSETCACDLAPGDIVAAIDGRPIEQAVADAGALLSAATEQHRTDKVLRQLRSGPEGGRQQLAIERGGVRREVQVALVAPEADPEEQRPPSGAEIAPGIRYLNLDKATEEQWRRILPDLAAARAVVCDMRGYPAFNLTTSLQHFTKKQLRSAHWRFPMPVRPDREGMMFSEANWPVPPAEPFIANVVFLTDGRAVSAAETYMGIVEAFKLGPIVGSATAGTNGNINPFKLPGGYLVWWTGMKVLKHDGSRHHGVGIQPTVPAHRTLAGVTAKRDEVLEKGIEVAQQLVKASANKAPASKAAPRKAGQR